MIYLIETMELIRGRLQLESVPQAPATTLTPVKGLRQSALPHLLHVPASGIFLKMWLPRLNWPTATPVAPVHRW